MQASGVLQTQASTPPLHWPSAVQTSSLVHGLPSSQALPKPMATGLQTPVDASQTDLLHAVSCSGSHQTFSSGSFLHCGGKLVAKSQYNGPVHRLPSYWAMQSWFCWHMQTFDPHWHLPLSSH